MRSTLYLKFIIVYIVFGFLSIFSVGTLTSELTISHLKEETGDVLCEESTRMASNYLPIYFMDKTSLRSVRLQLIGMGNYLKSNIWFTETDGTLIASSSLEGQPEAPKKLKILIPLKMEI